MARYETILTDSLEKIRPDAEIQTWNDTTVLAWPGETVSFQIALRLLEGETPPLIGPSLSVTGPGARGLRIRRVQLVPVLFAAPSGADTNYLTHTAAMLPDALLPIERQELPRFRCIGNQWDAFWCDWRLPIDAPAGEYPLQVKVYTDEGQEITSRMLVLEIQPQPLPPQRLLHTQWFHADCLADYYGIDVWSPEHWRIVENFIISAADHGVNMLFTPLVTPALDTDVGKERTTCQLLDIRLEAGAYIFDFSRLDRWIALCRKHGILELEMCHLFTQWGATAAPKVMARVDGEEKQLFGWDTPATGSAYINFLHCLLPKLKDHLGALGMLEHTWFHISDEPNMKKSLTMESGAESVADLLNGCHVLDAVSDVTFYKQGLIPTPVASNNSIEPFVQARVPNLWTYYCCSQYRNVPNRFIALPSSRNRILGVLLYRYDLQGFLHWGFNFYNGVNSRKHIDPWQTTDGEGAWPAGDPFLVYPAPDGTAWESIRGAVLREALQDYRLLCLAEKLLGRNTVLRLLAESWNGKTITMEDYPTDSAWFVNLRKRLKEIMEGTDLEI